MESEMKFYIHFKYQNEATDFFTKFNSIIHPLYRAVPAYYYDEPGIAFPRMGYENESEFLIKAETTHLYLDPSFENRILKFTTTVETEDHEQVWIGVLNRITDIQVDEENEKRFRNLLGE